MANYGIKYYAYYDLPDGGRIKMDIQQKDYSGPSIRMAGMKALTLEVGGGNAPVYEPIIKTSLHFSVVDAFDIGAIVGGVSCVTTEDGELVKHGRWEEFYTNDATRYKVILQWIGTNDAAPVRTPSTIWQGYITPDSWGEDMIYHGTINVTARDMLGTLQDVDFKETGFISVGDLLQQAFTICGVLMPCILDSSRSLRNIREDISIFAAQINCAVFEGKTWWNAVADTLEALGMVLRYDGAGNFVAAALRYLPDIQTKETHGLEFINRTGHRTLEPPVKNISSTFRVEFQEGEIEAPEGADLVASKEVRFAAPVDRRVNTYDLSAPSGGWAVRTKQDRYSLFYKITLPAAQSLIDSGFTDFAPMYFLGDIYEANGNFALGDTPIETGMVSAPCRLIARQNGPILTTNGSEMLLPYGYGGYGDVLYISSVLFEISCLISDGTTMYYDGQGSWLLDEVHPEAKFGQGVRESYIELTNVPAGYVANSLRVSVYRVEVEGEMNLNLSFGKFVPLSFFLGEPQSSTQPTEYSVVTEFNDDYNVQITRTPVVGSIDSVLPAAIFKNILSLAGYYQAPPLADSWNWAGETKGYPLEVMVQAQILMHYSVALSVFTGSAHDTTYQMAIPGTSYNYYGRKCIVTRATYDFTTGYIADVALREFVTWEEVWGTFAPEYTIEKSRGSGGGSSGGSGSSGGGGGGTTVVWGDETAAHYAPLSVGSDQRTVALEGHVHTIPQITGLQDALDAINGVIPAQASTSNQLADKDFVNSSIATNTATYISYNGQPFTSVAQLQAYTGPHDNNDYAFVVGKDADGNTTYTRYKYNGKTSTWGAEYVLNNSSFTAAQWAAINSGITEALRQKLAALPTAEALNDTLNHLEEDKQDTLTFDDVPTSGSSNPVKSGGIFNRFVEIVNLIGQKATAAWGAVTNYVAKLTINGTEKEVLLKGWNPGFAGNTGLPTYAHPGGEESYKYTKGASGTEQTITEELNQGQPRKIDHIGTHPELSAPVAIPGFINDLAYFRQRGGGCKLYVNNVERTDEHYAYYKDALFNCGPGSMSFDGTHTYTPEGGSPTTYHLGLTSPSDTARISLDFTTLLDAAVQLDSTYFTTKFAYGSYLYIDFGNDWWGPRECTAIVKYGRFTRNAQGGVASIIEDTANRQTFKFTGPGDEGHLDFLRIMINSGTSYGIIGIDIVFTGFHKDTSEATVYKYKPRVSEIGVVGLSSRGPAEGLMARGADDPVYRSITPAKEDTYDLGAAAKRWRYAYVKRVYLSATAYLEIGQDGKAHLYGATGLVVENGDIASAG